MVEPFSTAPTAPRRHRTPGAAAALTVRAPRNAPSVRALWCDYGGVLTSPVADALTQVAAAAEVPAPDLMAAIRQVAEPFGGTLIEPLELGILPQREWGLRVTAALAPRWTPRIDLTRFGDHWYVGRTVSTELFTLLERVRDQGVRVGMLTNSVREWEPHRRALAPDVDPFEVTVNSFEVGLRKPDPAIFRLAESIFRVPPESCLLIDDLGANCAAARVLGWQTIEHTTVADTLDLVHRLVFERH
ncbi:HAD-IA family hydrolase [Parafrankia sp. EUN1f]|uniref:HAD-IA family hydrolase n=1 Tax=Parafrankia sp. EUN1f TaxID=102897 RepID=UPI0001C46BE2|nr:HAD-IA family hydrolase [Parafrankia sp. EUN1f]EFC80914.1 HAD-superfamily hydrolase, subfamily IA, variant 3 [Parafrankia sp. EUN1f]